MTFEINNVLFILPFGSMDSKQTKIKGEYVFIVATNTGLDYISMTMINLTDNTLNSCYIEGVSTDESNPFYGILDMELDEQIKILELDYYMY